jgi:hypothetical protein
MYSADVKRAWSIDSESPKSILLLWPLFSGAPIHATNDGQP